MSIMLEKLVQQVSYMDFKLVAGEAGLTNEVRWIHMVDSDAVSAFLLGQELVFTTGLGLDKRLTLLKLVKDVYEHGASGIVINIGPYISEIGGEVLTFAKEHDFPVFEVPWEVHMAEIMRIFSFSITKAEQNEMELAAAFSNAFRCPTQEELYVSTLMQKGLLSNWRYAVAEIRIMKDGQSIVESELNKYSSKLNSFLKFHYSGVMECQMEDRLFVVFSNIVEDVREEIIREILKKVTAMMEQGEQAVLCCGREISGLTNMYQSYRQAEKMCDMLLLYTMPGEETFKERGKMLMYEKMGMYRLLLTLRDEQAMKDYVEDTVKPLYDYDSKTQGDLVKTMQCYLQHNCSIKEAADVMIVHRNTVNYKMKKAEELLGMDLSSFEVRFQLNLGFLVVRMLSVKA